MPGQHRLTAHASRAAVVDLSPRRLGSTLGNALLTIAAIGGVLCIVAVIAASVFQVSLILFKTGSMSPGIPAGSVALVRAIPATAAKVGDVVTVDRAGELPITHRVVAVSAAARGAAVLTLRGDANPQNDPTPYRVERVRLVIGSLPGGAQLIVFASNPYVLGCVTVAVSVLVGWAFWPRRRDDEDAPAAETPPVARALGLVAFAITVPLAAALGTPSAAYAAPAERVVSSKYLTLTSIADPTDLENLKPGVPVRWEVGVSAHPPETATIHLGVSATGVLAGPGGLRVSVKACTERWAQATCPGVSAEMLGDQTVASAISTADSNGVREFGAMPSTEQRWLAVDVTLPPNWSPGSGAELRIHAWGAGDEAQTASQPTHLAETGTSLPKAGFALAGAALVIGIAAATTERRRRRHLADRASGGKAAR